MTPAEAITIIRECIEAGHAADDLTAEFLAVLDHDQAGDLTVLITVYFED